MYCNGVTYMNDSYRYYHATVTVLLSHSRDYPSPMEADAQQSRPQHATMSESAEVVALETVESLEARLGKVEYVLNGNVSYGRRQEVRSAGQNVFQRLAQLERALEQLRGSSKVVDNLLRLRTSEHPLNGALEADHDADARNPDWFQPSTAGEVPSLLKDGELLAIVMAMADIYPTSLSGLTAISDTPVPPTEASVTLVNLYPRIDRLRAVQEEQIQEIDRLRYRSATAVKRWYQNVVLGSGECWADWDERVDEVERRVKRMERARRTEE